MSSLFARKDRDQEWSMEESHLAREMIRLGRENDHVNARGHEIQ